MKKSNQKQFRIVYTREQQNGVALVKAETLQEALAEFRKAHKGCGILMARGEAEGSYFCEVKK